MTLFKKTKFKTNSMGLLIASTLLASLPFSMAHATIKNDLQEEATRLTQFANTPDIQTIVKTANQNNNTKTNSADLINNSIAKKLSDNQQNSSLKIIGSMMSNNQGDSLGQTMSTSATHFRFAENYIKTGSTEPKISTRQKVSFNPTPVARIIVPITDSSDNKQIIGCLTEWIEVNRDKNTSKS